MELRELLATWSERDERYGVRRQNGISYPLTDEEIKAIRYYRWEETKVLAANDQRLARMAIERWSPPLVGR